MLMCGPAPFRQTVESPNGPADLYAADGALRCRNHSPDGKK
jgi:hypothetical protein